MLWRDIKLFIASYLGAILAIAFIGVVMRRETLDEFDFLHALIFAAMSVVVSAIREVQR